MYLFKHENCFHASVEGAPKVSGHASISYWAVGARGSGGHHGLGGVPTKWREHKSTSTYILSYIGIQRGCLILLLKHPLVATATAVAAACHLPPLQPQSLRGFIVIVIVVIVIVTAVTTVSPPLFCDLLLSCVLPPSSHNISSPSPLSSLLCLLIVVSSGGQSHCCQRWCCSYRLGLPLSSVAFVIRHPVGNLPEGYIPNVPLPRVPWD